MRQAFRKRQLSFESLEGRELLAGNINAGLDVNGNLVLTGDVNNNHVIVTRAFFSNQIIVQGGQSGSGDSNSSTLINGVNASRSFNTTGGVIVNMGDGNDRVMLTDIGVQGNVTGNLGRGNDQFALQSSSSGASSFTLNDGSTPTFSKASVSGLVNISAGDGNDLFAFDDATVGGDFTFGGGNGFDRFVSTGTDPDNNAVFGSVVLNPGGANDSISINRMAVGANFTINDGAATSSSNVNIVNIRVNLDILMNLSIFADNVVLTGEDNGANRFQARNVQINTGNGVDRVQVDRGIMVDLIVSTGIGAEQINGAAGVNVTNLNVNNRVYVDTGDGNDIAFLNLINTDTLRVYAQSGADRITANNISATDALYNTLGGQDFLGLHDSTYFFLSAFLGDDNDTLQIRSLKVTNSALFDGGSGVNTYQNQGGNTFNSLQRRNI